MRSLIPSFWSNNHTARFDPFSSLRRDMQDMFGMIERRLPQTNGNGTDLVLPSIDLCESPDHIEIAAELPGMAEKDISVTLEGQRLTISGNKKKEMEEKDKDYYLSERSFGAFSRTLPLDFEPDARDIDARFDKGVLTVKIKKPASLKAEVTAIPVKG